MKISIDIKFFLIVLVFFLTNQIEIYACVIFSIILHEIGHLLAGIMVKMQPTKIGIVPLGMSISFSPNVQDFNIKVKNGNLLEVKKIFVAIAGPIVNVIIIFIANMIDISSEIKLIIVYSNILLLIFNLIPIYPLDGARIIRGIVHIILGKRKSIHVIRNISIINLIIFTSCASVGILFFKNISFVLIPIILWLMFMREERIFKAKEYIYMTLDKLKKENQNNMEK